MKCVAYIEGPSLCRNGFPQNSACRGSTCHACGRHTETVSACMNEDIRPMWLNDDGSPKYAAVRAAITQQKGN